MKSILIICYSSLHRDPRVLRQILILKNRYNIIAAGFTDPGIDGIEYIELDRIFRTRLEKVRKLVDLVTNSFENAYWHKNRKEELEILKARKFDLIIANDLDTLPFAERLSRIKNVKLIFDAHEYYPDFAQGRGITNYFLKKQVLHQCKEYLSKVDKMLTVSSGIKRAYLKNFGIESSIYRNTIAYYELKPSEVGSEIHLVHHGLAAPARKLEAMIQMMNYLDDRFIFHLYLVVNDIRKDYFEFLQELAAKTSKKIQFHEPVNTKILPSEINKYDLGIYILPGSTLNQKYALPNKFFEFVQGRLGIAIGPSEEMMDYVNKYGIGIVADDFTPQSLANKLNSLSTDQVAKFKDASDKFAYELSFVKEEELLNSLVNEFVKEA